MAEYIDKAQVQTELMMSAERYTVAHESNGFGKVEWSNNLIPVSKAMEIIRSMPSVDAVPVVHGRWQDEGDLWLCTACGKGYVTEAGVTPIDAGMHYCPNCGADMRGEQDG